MTNGNGKTTTTEIVKVKVDYRAIAKNEDVWVGTYDGKNVHASRDIVRSLVPGAREATDYEIASFLGYCMSRRCNPLDRSIHFVKYKAKNGKPAPPAFFHVSYHVYVDQGQRHSQFAGYSAGVVWWVDGKPVRGKPCDFLQDAQHKIIGAWATVHRKDRKVPVEIEIPISELPNQSADIRKAMPIRMAIKNAVSEAFRNAFSDEIGVSFTDVEALPLPPETGASTNVLPREERQQLEGSSPEDKATTPLRRVALALETAIKAALPLLPEVPNEMLEVIMPKLAVRANGGTEAEYVDDSAWSDDLALACLEDLAANGLDADWLPSPKAETISEGTGD